jgi:hypothetical protein
MPAVYEGPSNSHVPTRPAAGSVPTLALIVLVSAIGLAVVAVEANVPRFFMDELYYMKAGVSLADGHGLAFEGTSWGYGPLHPLLVAAVVRTTHDQVAAYEALKIANSLFFALTLVPIYLVARRTLSQRLSLGVVGLSAILPSTMYASVVMTEAMGYLLAWWAFLAIVYAFERPTASRQLLALGAIAGATASRPQLVALYAGYLLGLGLLALVSSTLRAGFCSAPISLWPTALSLLGGAAWLLWPVAHGRGLGAALGSYSALAASYHPLGVVKWLVYEVGNLALYVGVIPVLVAPTVLSGWWARARHGSQEDAATLSLFAAQSLAGLAVVAAFASTPAGLGILYDRYLFYLAPLWFVVFLSWIGDGLAFRRAPFAVGTAMTIVALAALPPGIVGGQSWFRHFEATATNVWGKVDLVVARLPLVSLRVAVVGFGVLCIAAVTVPTFRRAWVAVTLVALVLLANVTLSWHSAFVPQSTYGLGVGKATWVDDLLGSGADVTGIVVGRPCPRSKEERFATLETDFFNRNVRRLATFGGEGGGAPSALVVRPDGRLLRRTGEPLAAQYVVVPAGIKLAGAELGTGMAPGLALWHVGGAVRVIGADAKRQLLSSRCTS